MKRLSLRIFVDKVLESLSIVCDSLYAFNGGSLSVPGPVREKPFVKAVPPAPRVQTRSAASPGHLGR